MKMPEIIRTLFTRSNPAKDEALQQVRALTAENVKANNGLTNTIDELLARNDALTFRKQNAQPVSKP